MKNVKAGLDLYVLECRNCMLWTAVVFQTNQLLFSIDKYVGEDDGCRPAAPSLHVSPCLTLSQPVSPCAVGEDDGCRPAAPSLHVSPCLALSRPVSACLAVCCR